MSLEFKTPDWLKKYGSLVVGYSAVAGFVYILVTVFPSVTWLLGALFIACAVVWTAVWLYLENLPPRNRTSKFGICLIIKTTPGRGRELLENDILMRVNETIRNQGLENLLHFNLASQDQAEKYAPFMDEIRMSTPSNGVNRNIEIDKKFERFQSKTNFHLFIWGALLTERRSLEHNGENIHVLKTDAIIHHSELDQLRKGILIDQFKWIPEFKISQDAEYEGLQFVADEIVYISDLVVGTAAALVGNIEPALEIHERLLNHLKLVPLTPNRERIIKHLRIMIADELCMLAATRYIKDADTAAAKELLNRSFTFIPNHHNSLVLLAKIQFEYEQNPIAALSTTKKMASVSGNNGTWRYNEAFLEMYLERPKKAWRIYQEIFNRVFVFEDEVVTSVINFNDKQVNNGFLPALFIIGMLYFKKKRNLPLANEYLERFLLETAESDDYNFLRNIATKQNEMILQALECG